MKAKTDQAAQPADDEAAVRQREILRRRLLEMIKRNERQRRDNRS